jgi:SAM-dependent methyltransferase
MTKKISSNDSKEKFEPWFSPDRLDKERLKYENMDPEIITSDNDFASYAKVSRGIGIKGSSIEKHNLINCDMRAKLYFELLGRKRLSNIADVGCGIGLTSIALSKIFNADIVIGFDISQDAINYAKMQSSKKNKFIVKKIEPNTPLGMNFNLIVAQEFYPFTRTKDLQVHIGYLESLISSLTKPNGNILIGLSSATEKSIMNNLDKIKSRVELMGARLSIYKLPNEKIYRFIKNFQISNFLTKIIYLLINKNQFVVIKISV